MSLDNHGNHRGPPHATPRATPSSLNHVVYESVRSLPLMLSAEQACWCRGIAPANLYRRVKDGTIKQGVLISPRCRRWEKAYILSLMGPRDPGPAVAIRA